MIRLHKSVLLTKSRFLCCHYIIEIERNTVETVKESKLYFATLIVNNDEEGAGHTEKAGADEDDHRHQQHEHEVGVGRLQAVERKYFVFD